MNEKFYLILETVRNSATTSDPYMSKEICVEAAIRILEIFDYYSEGGRNKEDDYEELLNGSGELEMGDNYNISIATIRIPTDTNDLADFSHQTTEV
jgi:hypothetical protein